MPSSDDAPSPSRRGHDLASTSSPSEFALFEKEFSMMIDLEQLHESVEPSCQSLPSSLRLQSSSFSFLESFIVPVGSASLMITGNTVGAGMLVLPELAAGPGMGLSAVVLAVAWLMNLVSGLTIAQVAIQQHETSGSEVPSSFKEFAEATLPSAANLVSGISVFINSLILAFDVYKAGEVGDSLLLAGGMTVENGHIFSLVWAAVLGSVVATQRLETLSRVASVLVVGLFATFAALLLPGLANVSDPLSVLVTGPSVQGAELMEAIFRMVPVVITTLVFQNIVPTVTRFLEYDRVKITTALVTGSIIPLFMYAAWCTTILGGGIMDDESGGFMALGGLLLSVFSLITVGGSSLGSLVSLSEELSIILGFEKKETFSIPSVALPIAVALGIGQVFSSDITSLLEIAGSYGSPLLYGAIPVAMAWTQQQQLQHKSSTNQDKPSDTSRIYPMASNRGGPSVVPGGILGLAMLGLGSTALVGSELVETLSQSSSSAIIL